MSKWSAGRRARYVKDIVRSFECAMRAYGDKSTVGQCPERSTPLPPTRTVRVESVGALRGPIGASRKCEDAMCCAEALLAGTKVDEVEGFT